MYRHCIFCSSDLRANEALPEFPVGHRVAFDGARGRLWAICPRCHRWNLAPIEERWEALESAERLFRDARLRVQSENVGLARLPDGFELVRVGDAVPGELAAWRYGRELVSRRRQYMVGLGGLAVLTATSSILQFAGLAPVAVLAYWGIIAHQSRRQRQVLQRISGAETPGGLPMTLRYSHLGGARLTTMEGGMALMLPFVPTVPGVAERTLVLRGATARAVLGKALVRSNGAGAKLRQLDGALALLAEARSPDEYLRSKAIEQAGIGFPYDDDEGDTDFRRVLRRPGPPVKLAAGELLALEMALHEDSERAALEGELAALRAAWREAEEIARIADALPGEPPEDRRVGR